MARRRASCSGVFAAPRMRNRWSKWAAAGRPRRKAASARRPCAAFGKPIDIRWDCEETPSVSGGGGGATEIERQLAAQDLNARYVEAIDDGRFEAWPDFF